VGEVDVGNGDDISGTGDDGGRWDNVTGGQVMMVMVILMLVFHHFRDSMPCHKVYSPVSHQWSHQFIFIAG
jgi:hypothetical protein